MCVYVCVCVLSVFAYVICGVCMCVCRWLVGFGVMCCVYVFTFACVSQFGNIPHLTSLRMFMYFCVLYAYVVSFNAIMLKAEVRKDNRFDDWSTVRTNLQINKLDSKCLYVL